MSDISPFADRPLACCPLIPHTVQLYGSQESSAQPTQMLHMLQTQVEAARKIVMARGKFYFKIHSLVSFHPFLII